MIKLIATDMGVTLRDGNREYFYKNLDKHFTGLKEKYIRTYANSYILNSPNNEKLMKIFHETCDKHNIMHNNDEIFNYINTFEQKKYKQLKLF